MMTRNKRNIISLAEAVRPRSEVMPEATTRKRKVPERMADYQLQDHAPNNNSQMS
jgi:hypothetical protein